MFCSSFIIFMHRKLTLESLFYPSLCQLALHDKKCFKFFVEIFKVFLTGFVSGWLLIFFLDSIFYNFIPSNLNWILKPPFLFLILLKLCIPRKILTLFGIQVRKKSSKVILSAIASSKIGKKFTDVWLTCSQFTTKNLLTIPLLSHQKKNRRDEGENINKVNCSSHQQEQ